METKIQKNNSIIIVALGSTALKITCSLKAIYQSFANTVYSWSHLIGFDGQNVDHTMFIPAVDKELENLKLLPHEIIGADIGDKQSRKKAENDGFLWSLPQDFHLNPAAAGENAGVGGDMRAGYGLFRLNENSFKIKIESAIRQCLDYQLKNNQANMEDGKSSVKPVVEVFVLNTLTGGTGSSAYPRAMTIIKDIAEEKNIDLKILPISTIIGTLNPATKKLAAINQQSALKNTISRLEFGFTDLDHADGDLRAVCKPPVYISNANNFGELANLDRTLTKTAYILYLMIFTGFGRQARQYFLDHYTDSSDQYGTLRKGASIGISNISFTRPKLIQTAAFDYAQNLINNILANDYTEDFEKITDTLLTNLSVKETFVQSMLVDRILSTDNGKNNAVDRVLNVFRDRCGKRWGFAGCRDIILSSTYARQNELNTRILPAVEDNTVEWMKSVKSAIANEIRGYLKSINGLCQSKNVLDKISQSLTEIAQKNDKSLSTAKRSDKNIKSQLNSYENLYNSLIKKFWLFRFFSFSDKAVIKENYPPIVEADIKNTLQIFARTLIKEKVLPFLTELIAELKDYLYVLENNIAEFGCKYRDSLTRLCHLPSYLYDAGGYELADQKFISANIKLFYTELGNKKEAALKAFESFIGNFGSLDCFISDKNRLIQEQITENGMLLADTVFKTLNVYDVFQKAFPTDKQKSELLSSIIDRSCLSIKITGEGDEAVSKVKFVCGNDIRLVEWAVKKANQIDRKGGDWNSYLDENLPDGLSFIQYRTNISIAQLIKDTSAIAALPSKLQDRVKIGENPIISLMPEPDCNDDGSMDDKLNMVIAEGLACKAIIESNDGFILSMPLKEPVYIGKSVKDILNNLSSKYGYVVYCCRKFAQELLENKQTVIAELKSEKTAKLAGKQAANQALEVANLLMPYLRRLKANLPENLIIQEKH